MKIKMKPRIAVVLLSFFVALQSCFGGSMDKFEHIVNSITRKTGQQIEKENQNLTFVGIGGSMSADGVINFETLAFNVKGKIDRNKGVELISKVVTAYKKNIYSDERMASYLNDHPFTFNNLRIELFILDSNGDEVLHPDLKFISLDEGFIYYTTVKDSKYYSIASDMKEPYEDALYRVRERLK